MSFLLVFYLPQSKIICLHDPALHISQASFLLLFLSPYSSITSHTHNWVLLLLWFCLFILFGVVSPLISSSILNTYQPGEFIFQCHTFLPFQTVYEVLEARILKLFAFPSPVGHVLSELSTMTRLSWVALHSMAHH